MPTRYAINQQNLWEPWWQETSPIYYFVILKGSCRWVSRGLLVNGFGGIAETPWKSCVWHGCEQAVGGCRWCAAGTAATRTAGRAGAVRVSADVGLLSCKELLPAGKNAWSRVLRACMSLSISGEPSAAGFWATIPGVQSGRKELRLSVPWGAVGSVQAVNTDNSNDLVRQAARDKTGSVIPLKNASSRPQSFPVTLTAAETEHWGVDGCCTARFICDFEYASAP